MLEPRPLVRRSLGQALKRAGVHRVLEAESAPVALQMMSAELVQLVITPWADSGMEGRALLRSLQRRGRNRDVPVVVLDDRLSQDQVISAVKAGMAGRLPPGADATEVHALLQRIAAERSASPADWVAPSNRPPDRPRTKP